MADQQPGGMGAGSFMAPPMPRFPPPQAAHAMPPAAPPCLPYPPFAHNSSAPQGFSGPGQVYQQQPQQHPPYFGPPFPGTRPIWPGYGFQGPPPSYGSQIPCPVGMPGPLTISLPGTNNSPQISTRPSGIGFAQQSFNNSHSQNASQVTSPGQIAILPPGIGPGQFRSHSGPQVVVSQAFSAVTSSVTSAGQSDTRAQAPLAAAKEQSSVTDYGLVGSGSVSEKPQSVNLVEQAIREAEKDKVPDVKEVLSQLRSLLFQVEKAAKQVEAVVNIDLGSGKESTVTCPFDPAHKISTEGLFQHCLRCPCNPKPKTGAALIKESRGKRDIRRDAVVKTRLLNSESTSCFTTSSGTEFDILGGKFFYDSASAVVQAPPSTVHSPFLDSPPAPDIQSPERLSKESETVNAAQPRLSAGSVSVSRDRVLLLPSRYFFLSKEIEGWQELPSRTSSLVMEAAGGLGKVGRREVVDWLLLNSPTHGVVLDPILGCQMYTLARACFQDVQSKALALVYEVDHKRVAITDGQNVRTGRASGSEVSPPDTTADVGTDSGGPGGTTSDGCLFPKVELLNCAGVFQSVSWLSAQLCSLYGPSESKNLTLNLLKHSLVVSGRLQSSPCVGTAGGSNFPGRNEVEDNGSERRTDGLSSEPPVVSERASTPEAVEVRNSRFSIQEMEAAVSAVHERAVLERYLRNPFPASCLPKFQLLQEYEAAVRLAVEERMKRPDYRPVLESDGLIWHRSQLEEKNKNKTREELLAEERDYKRRRMSYRGKKLKRTPTQVVRDIIDGHMEEINAAGGIGCAVKQSTQGPFTAQVSKGEMSVASSESGGQQRMPKSNSSSVGRVQSDFQIHEKVRGPREQSAHQSEPSKPNEGFRVGSKQMNISRVETDGGGESAEEQYHSRRSNSRNRGAEYLDHLDHAGGRSTGVSHRSSSTGDQWEYRTDSEGRNVRSPSHQDFHAGRYSTKRPNGSDGHHGTGDRKSRRDYGDDSGKARKYQPKILDSNDRYRDGEDPREDLSRSHYGRSGSRKRE